MPLEVERQVGVYDLDGPARMKFMSAFVSRANKEKPDYLTLLPI